MKEFIFPFLVMILGMIGGQRIKAVRRYGIPALSATFIKIGLKPDKTRKDWVKYHLLVVLMFVLSMGYGEHSWLRSVFKTDWATRFIYACLISLVFIIAPWQLYLVCLLALVVVFQIRAGSLGQIGRYDILVEDILRYYTLGWCVAITYLQQTKEINMEFVTNLITWFSQHGTELVQLYLQIIGAASILVVLTPGEWDNQVLQKIKDFVAKYIALNK